MSVNATHPDYDASLPAWLRARDVIAGEDAVKSAGEKYLPRLEAQTDEEYDAYRARASPFNATARTADGYLGFVSVPDLRLKQRFLAGGPPFPPIFGVGPAFFQSLLGTGMPQRC